MERRKVYNEECEAAVLKAMMYHDQNLITALGMGLNRDDFYGTDNKNLFDCIIGTYKEKKDINELFVRGNIMEYGVPYEHFDLIREYGFYAGGIEPYIKELFRLRVNHEFELMSLEVQSNKLNGVEAIRERVEKIEELRARGDLMNVVTTLDKVEIVDIHKMEKVKTGFKGIDDKILGFVFGSLNVITGYNANGKSTLINQMVIAESIKQGYKVFAFSPELTNSNLKRWLYPTLANKEHFVNETYEGKNYKTVGKKGISLIDEWISDKLYTYTDKIAAATDQQILATMKVLVKQGVRIFIIDNLMKVSLRNEYKDKLVAVKDFVEALKSFAKEHNVLVHLVAHPKKPQEGNTKISKFDIAGTGDIANLADYVIAISRLTDEEKAEGGKDACIKIMKDRPNGSSDFSLGVNFDTERKRFYEYGYQLNKDYGYMNSKGMVEVDTQIVF